MSLHLMPQQEGVEHIPSYDCPCRPHRDVVDHQGVLRWAVVHRAEARQAS